MSVGRHGNGWNPRVVGKLGVMIDAIVMNGKASIEPFASVGLWVSGSHDLGEITYEIIYNLIMLFAVI